ncbi:MAG: class I SAM-dependent methyltransferase [Bacteroidetes bacterium]|nr:class I SAM-dependent methyltransferase [Bacteroidota bacterium]
MLYDDQATTYDMRAGIPQPATEAVAEALVEITGAGPGTSILEVGAGTGLFSIPLIQRSVRYTAFDRSAAMIGVLREKVAREGLPAAIVVSDGNAAWPADDASISVVFSVRALHHLEPDHVLNELHRVLRPNGSWLAVGRVRRPADSPSSVMRRRMRWLVQQAGYEARNHEARMETVFAALEAEGGQRLEPRTVARWTRMHRPADSLASWEGKEGLAGLELPQEAKGAILADLRAWAGAEFGRIDAPAEQEEFFELTAINVTFS